jgi:transcriptional regulator with XRE-family HTH domain
MPPSKDTDPASSPKAFFGSELRRCRTAARLTQEELGKLLMYDGSYISVIELGKQLPEKQSFAEGCDETFETDGLFVRIWKMARNANVIPAWMDVWLDHEREATMIRTWEPLVVHGLLQTSDYANVLLRDEAAVQVRMDRQQILTRDTPPPPSLHCVLDETVLWRRVGDRETMRSQLEHLVTMAERPGISVQVVPLGYCLGMRGAFIIATADGPGSEVTYVATAARGFTLTGRKDLAAVTDAWENIRSEALSRQESIELIRRTAEEKWT